MIFAKWAANAPLASIDQYVANLRRLDGIAIVRPAGWAPGRQQGIERDLLTLYGIEHMYETYEGDHVNRVAERYETRVLPFFSQHLAFE